MEQRKLLGRSVAHILMGIADGMTGCQCALG